MRRVAAHYLLSEGVLHRLHYAEMTDEGIFVSHHPLTNEIHSTAFYDGVIIIASNIPEGWKSGDFYVDYEKEEPSFERKTPYDFILSYSDVFDSSGEKYVYLLLRTQSSAKLGTNDARSHCHIERL
jgi:hypothetical protein